LVASTLVAVVSSFIVTRQHPATYQAKAILMIGRTIQDPNPPSREF
jgi:hypothetical protein